MSDEAQIVDTFVSKCRDALSENDDWTQRKYKLGRDHNFYVWLIWPQPPNEERPIKCIEVGIKVSSTCSIEIDGAKIEVNKDGTPIDNDGYHRAVDYVVRYSLAVVANARR